MDPTREIFWNIQNGEILYVIAALVVIGFAYAMYRRYKLWRLGRPADRFNHLAKRLRAFIVAAVVDVMLHRKFFGLASGFEHGRLSRSSFPPEFYPGIAHYLIFIGCGVLLLGAFLDFISHYFFDFMHGGFYLGYSLVTDVGGILVLIGAIMFIVRRYVRKPARLDNTGEDLTALILVCLVVITGFVVEGARIAATELRTAPSWALWSPGGFVFARALGGLSHDSLLTWHRVTWWLHMVISLGAIAFVSLYWNKLWHVIVSPLNVFFRSLESEGSLMSIDLKTARAFASARIENFTWKQLMDVDACIRCGRCQDACPANRSGKPLSPKKLVQDVRAHWLEQARRLPGTEDGKDNPGSNERSLVGDAVTEDEIMACTTCGACQYLCPVVVEHVNLIVTMRRQMVEQGRVCHSARSALESMRSLGNPWGESQTARSTLAEQLGLPLLDGKNEVELLYWIGCVSTHDERARNITRAMSTILKKAGIKYAVLGAWERCCGDQARRLGEEGLFQMLARSNSETFKEYGIRRILVQCPHCYNTFKNEYPRFGSGIEVVHHSELIQNLIKTARITPAAMAGQRLTFHDPCYLGRYNGMYTAPRRVLQAIPGAEVVEMKLSGANSFCCGAGGGHLWLQDAGGQRMENLRFEQAQSVSPHIIATACPYCATTLDVAASTTGSGTGIRVMDIAELVTGALL